MGFSFVFRLLASPCVLLPVACASSPSGIPHPAATPIHVDDDRSRTTAFAHVVDDAMAWLVAADPRLAFRADMAAPDTVLKRIGTDAVLEEDTKAQIRGGSLDLFAFGARTRAIEQAAKLVSTFGDPLPETGPLGSAFARPRLERELLARLIEEERARTLEESTLGDAASELVRGIVATWTTPATPQEWPDRDAWVSKHLLEIRESMRSARPLIGPSDLDMALYPLERLLAPLQFPRGSAAIAEVRMAIDADMRTVPPLDASSRIAHSVKLHIGLSIDLATLRPRLERVEQRLRERAVAALAASHDRSEIEGRARDLLLIESPCPAVPDTRVRSMAPPPERGAICGALRALTEESSSAPALVALHDDILLSLGAIMTVPPPRTGLLSRPDDEAVTALKRKARERPVLALGVALAAELLYGSDGAEERLVAWRALGEAPLDVVAREIAK